jgi:hypothetical protein
MPSLVPLHNALSQNSVDFNSQTPINDRGLLRYSVQDYNTNSHTLTPADFNSVCIFAGDTQLVLNNFGGVTPPTGTEIIFLSRTGYVRVATLNASLYTSNGPFTQGPYFAGKIIHLNNNLWVFAGTNWNPNTFTVNNCCAGTTTIYQLNTSAVFDGAMRAYTTGDLAVPFNGTIESYSDPTYYWNIFKNGYLTSTTADDCATYDYSEPYTFYAGPDPIYDAISFYSVSGQTPTVRATLNGNKFFISDVGIQHDCYATDAVSPGAPLNYYANPGDFPNSPLIFMDGYVINIT